MFHWVSISIFVQLFLCLDSGETKHDFLKLLLQQVNCVVSEPGSPHIVKVNWYLGFLNSQGFSFLNMGTTEPEVASKKLRNLQRITGNLDFNPLDVPDKRDGEVLLSVAPEEIHLIL